MVKKETCNILIQNGVNTNFKNREEKAACTIAHEKNYKSIVNIVEANENVNEMFDNITITGAHSGKYCYGKTPMQTFLDSKHIALEKFNESMHHDISDSHL